MTDGEHLTIATGLPSTYRISSLLAQHGTVSLAGDDGLDIVYEAPAQAVKDIIYLNYYEGSKLRGFAQLNIAASLGNILGDVNGDGVVNIADVAAVLNIMSGKSTGNGDVNGDGVVNIADMVAVLNIMAGN